MSTAILPAMPLPSARSAPAGTVFLPREHGSWSLALEPLALGLLSAPSWAGGALVAAALAGFFARRPLKAALGALATPRRVAARKALVVLSGLAFAGCSEMVVLAPWTAAWPLLPAAVLGLVFTWFDSQGESRAAAAEIAGSAAFACLPAAMATLAGLSAATALALAVLALARSVPTVLVVRGYLRMAKGGAPARTLPLLATGSAALALLALGAAQLAPRVAGLLGVLLLVRAAWLLGPWRPAWPASRIGMLEALLGLLCVGVMAAAYRA
ncbi:MAG: YwiC-like family protein [Verrucomicrobiota bacterium]